MGRRDSALAMKIRHICIVIIVTVLIHSVISAPLPKTYLDSVMNGEENEVMVNEDEKVEELKREPKLFGDWLSDTLPLAVANNEIVSQVLYVFGGGRPDEWEYAGRQGIEYWGTINRRCLGSAQSPINIDTTLARKRTRGDRIELENYDLFTEDNTKLENNGHTVELKVTTRPRRAKMSGGHLESEYELAQLHFHWGSEDTGGSEHTIDRVQFPLEMHLVHLAKTIDRYMQGGLAVAGFVFKISSDDNPDIQPIIERIGKIKKSPKGTRLKSSFNLGSLIEPSMPGPYFSYEGSLTTPGCDEVVEWILYKKPLEISTAQLAEFRTILDKKEKPVEFNFRPVQPLNDRSIQYFK